MTVCMWGLMNYLYVGMDVLYVFIVCIVCIVYMFVCMYCIALYVMYVLYCMYVLSMCMHACIVCPSTDSNATFVKY